jgi:hypothetical protein
MTDINHRRTNRPPVDRRYPSAHYNNGYPRNDGTERHRDGTLIERDERNANGRVGGTGYLDKSMHGWGAQGAISGVRVGASIGNDFAKGHRGMAKAVRGAKKFVRTRIRHHENAATRRLAVETDER